MDNFTFDIDLSDFFDTVKQARKEQRQELNSLAGDSFDSLWEQLKPYKTVEQIAKKHKVSVSKITQQLKMGIKVEKEHTKDEELAAHIALQHLDEFPDYYDRLTKIEKRK